MTIDKNKPTDHWGARSAPTVLLGAFFLVTLHTASFAEEGGQRTVKVPVDGLCILGLTDIRTGLSGTPGVSKVEGAMAGDGVEITYAPQQVSPDRITQIISDLGYGQWPSAR